MPFFPARLVELKAASCKALYATERAAGKNAEDAKWIDLEDGVQVAFAEGGDYRTGDYWLIPARVGSGKIEWPPAEQSGQMSLQEPRGVVHHYAPLGKVSWVDEVFTFPSCHCVFSPQSSCFKVAAPPIGGPSVPASPAPKLPTAAIAPKPSAPAKRRASKKGKRQK